MRWRTINHYQKGNNMILSFDIPGEPRAKQSASFRIAKDREGKQFVCSYQKKAVKDYEDNLQWHIMNQLPEGFRVSEEGVRVVSLTYVFTAPKSMRKCDRDIIYYGGFVAKTTKPDLQDNLNKMLFDAMQGLIFKNDSQVFEMVNVKKVYGNKPCTLVTLEIGERMVA